MTDYLFSSERLGFRNWDPTDLEPFAEMCADREVMKYFPNILSKDECSAFIGRMNHMLEERGHCYFAVDRLDKDEFIGFIGLKWQTDMALEHPYLDIGWRLAKSSWGKGLATEGAKRCLDWAFENLNEKKIYATATRENKPSIKVMKKIGMQYEGEYSEPVFENHSVYDKAVIYSISK